MREDVGEKNKPLGPKCCSTAVQRERERDIWSDCERFWHTNASVCVRACGGVYKYVNRFVQKEQQGRTNERLSAHAARPPASHDQAGGPNRCGLLATSQPHSV